MTSTATKIQDNPIGQHLRTEMKKRGYTSAEVAKRADVKTSFIYDVISGKSANPSTVKLARVAEALGISLNDLVGGSTVSAPQGDMVAIARLSADASGKTIVTHEPGNEAYAFRKDWIRDHLGANPSGLRIVSVRGDSMEPTLCHNDVVLVDTSKKHPSPPGIFVLFDGFGLVAKRLEHLADREPPQVRIISDNTYYSAYERSIESSFIIGRVVWFAREI